MIRVSECGPCSPVKLPDGSWSCGKALSARRRGRGRRYGGGGGKRTTRSVRPNPGWAREERENLNPPKRWETPLASAVPTAFPKQAETPHPGMTFFEGFEGVRLQEIESACEQALSLEGGSLSTVLEQFECKHSRTLASVLKKLAGTRWDQERGSIAAEAFGKLIGEQAPESGEGTMIPASQEAGPVGEGIPPMGEVLPQALPGGEAEVEGLHMPLGPEAELPGGSEPLAGGGLPGAGLQAGALSGGAGLPAGGLDVGLSTAADPAGLYSFDPIGIDIPLGDHLLPGEVSDGLGPPGDPGPTDRLSGIIPDPLADPFGDPFDSGIPPMF